jgi:hypothetical protein
MVEKKQAKLAANAEAMERWLRKLIRAANEVDELRRERKRLLKPAKLPSEAINLPNDAVPMFAALPQVPDKPKDDGLDIPKALDRRNAMADPRTKEKKAERRAVAKEVKEAELRGQRRKMPLSGKDALKAIQQGK